ncbi:hypothetical protein JOQ06_026982, partial [Pogonophryne albipinna]
MNEDAFLIFLKHFIRHTNCSTDHPVLLLLDKHESHISLKSVTIAKENGVIMLTLPPHTSHRLQPLDKTVYGPLKTYYNRAMDGWMRSHPGRTVSIYEVSELVKQTFLSAMSPTNITSGFRATGIYPFNRDIFPEEDYAPSMVTDRANPEDEPSATADLPGEEPSTSAAAHLPGPSHEPTHVTADPDPGEPPATLTNSEHLSKESSTTNDEAEDGLEKTHSREKERAEKKKRSGNKKGALKGSKPTKPKKKVLSSSSEESDFPIPLSDATHYESSDVQSDDDDGDKDLSAGDLVIVKFA